MKNGKDIDLGLTAYDELFMTDQERAEAKLPRIHDLPLDQVDDFPDHPFQVRMDEDMDQLVQSIRERGLITPITVRTKEDGRYEIVSGHRRKKACELAGMTTIKAEIRELSRDEAIILMVESNLQRSQILPSERALSYKMRYEALKRISGTRTDLTGDPLEPRLKTSELVAAETNESASQVKRYIRLTELIPDLLQMVDDGKIAMRPAVELSYLTNKEQQWLVEAIGYADCTPSHAQAIRMRAFSKDGTLGPHVIENIMNEDKPNQVEKISLRYKDARRYIPESVPYSQTGAYILKALEFYQRHLERQRDNRDAR